MTRFDRSSGNEQPESIERDPGIPKYYFLRTSKPLKPRKLTRSLSGPSGASGNSLAPADRRQQQLRRVGAATLRAKPLSLASLAEDLAPAFHSESVEELPPGISECRSKLEAFRSAAVEAISTEASMQIEQQRKNTFSTSVPEKPKRRQAGYRPPHKPALEGPPPGVDECRRKLLAFKELVEQTECQGDQEHLTWPTE